MTPVWIPPVTVKLEARAALPDELFERVETGAKPLSAAKLAAVCASAPAPPIIRASRPIPHPNLFMAPLLLNSPVSPIVGLFFCDINGQASLKIGDF